MLKKKKMKETFLHTHIFTHTLLLLRAGAHPPVCQYLMLPVSAASQSRAFAWKFTCCYFSLLLLLFTSKKTNKGSKFCQELDVHYILREAKESLASLNFTFTFHSFILQIHLFLPFWFFLEHGYWQVLHLQRAHLEHPQ